MKTLLHYPFKFVGIAVLLLGVASISCGSELHIGAATIDITPERPVPLDGQMHVRISEKAETPIFVTALALESRDGEQVLDQAIMVSCDIVAIRKGVIEIVREKAKDKFPGFDLNKLFLNATHTHTAPVTMKGERYRLVSSDVMKPEEYTDFMSDRIVEAAVQSWAQRKPGKAGWGQGQAVIAQNRRATYADGSAKMYGATNVPDFRGIEGYEDHNLDVLFFWDLKDQLIATAVNVPCPSQEVEGLKVIHADFWDPVRRQLRERFGKDLHILAWTGAGGDQVPRPMYGKPADERMRRLRGLTRLEEVARRVVRGWEEAYEGARLEPVAGAVLEHRVEKIELPWRKVTEKELADAQKGVDQYKDDAKEQWRYLWNKGVVDRYETEKAGTAGTFQMELHTLRLGDVAIATNEFELFTDYGVQMKARSPAVQTFLIQLTGSGGYLPTPRAVAGGSYSAIIQSSRVGPEGGQELVERTVNGLNELWKKK
ncbi:hypothetical protein DES53_102870 [Roseimicrobium gellanilyticum]|uniref:Neutral/alkaline ceramidase-like enzyme n=1 Tax=Roseimicrobium gellanilyticum TaxID=748857 RepID=A0A366HTA0_9BACT|nr:hypothetical protein [Roseimicrobium gellanilyticum]RBP46479.1 hypothetical protein DES53_102870 [Roseimicrobium gellanilyticum]